VPILEIQLLKFSLQATGRQPIHPAPVDAAGRTLEEGGRLTAYYTGRDGRAAWRPDMPAILARAIGIDPSQMPRDTEMARLFEARRADNGEAWSAHPRKLSGVDLVFSPDKSVTLAAEFAPMPAESALIWNATTTPRKRRRSVSLPTTPTRPMVKPTPPGRRRHSIATAPS
jgi:hypothetical protein